MPFLLKKSLLIFILILPILIKAQQEKIDPSVFQHDKGSKVEIVVVMQEQADLKQAQFLTTKEQKGEFVFQILRGVSQRSQKDIQAFLNTQSIDYQSLWIVNALFLKADIGLIQQLANRSDVAQIVYNVPSHIDLPAVEPFDIKNNVLKTRGALEITWGISKIQANQVWNMGHKGKGAIVGGQDTGYDWEHPAIKKLYRGFNTQTKATDHNYNWYDAIHLKNFPDSLRTNPCGYDSQKPCDDNNHGTHTMGTMVGLDDTIAIGVAPEAQWIAARNMDRGNGTLMSYTECFQWFLAPTDTANKAPNPLKSPHVINNSWYCSSSEGCNATNFSVLETAMNACRAAGIVVVASNGNAGPNCSSVNEGPPAFFQKAFSVGATQQTDTIASFSSRGAVTIDNSNRLKPNVSAPGVGVKSSIKSGGYAFYNGTSMAGPHVAGVVALMISANPKIAGQVDTIERIIERTAKPMITAQNCGGVLGTNIPNNTYGYGRIDALEAVKQALAFRLTPTAEAFNTAQIKVFPNPFSSQITLNTEGVSGETTVQILNMNGQILYQRKEIFNSYHTLIVPLPQLSTGVYMYRISNGKQFFSGKVVKM